MGIIEIVFWISIGLIIYSTIIYLLLLKVFKHKKYVVDENYLPSITLIICAYNEEKNILNKLKNVEEIEYPLEKMQVILADDGSDDGTVKIAKNFKFVNILSLDRLGKTNAQNEAAKVAENEILVFSDANSIYRSNALKKLVRNFSDEKVGVVCGELRYHEEKSEEGLYWKYEIAIKKAESRNGWLLGANGSIYAIRTKSYVPLPKDAISDHLEPIKVYGNGLDIIYESEAIAVEDAPKNVMARKRRIILRSLISIKYILNEINPFSKRSIFIPYVSHKLIRWFTPIFLLITLLSNWLLINYSSIYLYAFYLQILFYLFGLVISPIRYFLKVNIASLFAIIDWFIGKKQNTWEVIR
jgi:cellulose synthase/poly-beta-1,6-N-acetylglucosamine synthase-like glycosyltransferase|tara:strand:+ start:2824 stop:3891 length:1068 start_codon:yes stop_codon:yes gene_type:complete